MSIATARHQVDRRFTAASFRQFLQHTVGRVLETTRTPRTQEVLGGAVSWQGQKSGRRCLSGFPYHIRVLTAICANACSTERERILFFGNILGYLNRVLADGAKTRRKLSCSVGVLHTLA